MHLLYLIQTNRGASSVGRVRASYASRCEIRASEVQHIYFVVMFLPSSIDSRRASYEL